MSDEINWENCYQNGVKPWDKGAPAPPLLDWMDQNPGRLGGRILVPGCGLGHDMRALAARLPEAEIIGIDVAPSALEEAKSFEQAGNESYWLEDLFDLPDSMRGSFDWVFEHTCFCAIDPDRRDEYVKAVAGTLKPEGQLLAVFYLDPYDDEHRPGGGPPHGCSVEELETRFSKTGPFLIHEQFVPNVSYPGREGLELMMRLSFADKNRPG